MCLIEACLDIDSRNEDVEALRASSIAGADLFDRQKKTAEVTGR